MIHGPDEHHGSRCDATRDSVAGPALTYTIDRALGILRQRWRGDIAEPDVVRFWNELIQDPETLLIGRHLNDLRECTLRVSGDDWLDMIVRVLEQMPPHAAWKAAIVVDSAETFGVVRQFLGYAGDLVDAEIFTDADSAERWLLGLPRDAAVTAPSGICW